MDVKCPFQSWTPSNWEFSRSFYLNMPIFWNCQYIKQQNHNLSIEQAVHTMRLSPCTYWCLLEIWARFPPQLPFSSSIIISDKIRMKMSLSLSTFLVLPQNFPCKILWDNRNIDANIFIFQIPFSQCWGPRRKKLFWGYFLSIKKSACVPNLKFLRHPQQVFSQ